MILILNGVFAKVEVKRRWVVEVERGMVGMYGILSQAQLQFE